MMLNVVVDEAMPLSPRYFSPLSVALLALLVFVNTQFSFKLFGLESQIMALLIISSIWLFQARIRLDSMVFGSVALMPATALWGVGYIALPGASISLSDIFTIATLCLFPLIPKPLQNSKFIIYTWLLLLACLISLILAENSIAHLGQFIRIFISASLVTIILSSRDECLKRPVLYGMLVWPIIAFSYIAGVEEFWRFISFGNGAVFNNNETGEVLLGSHVMVVYIIFSLPLALFLKISKIKLFILVTLLMAFSIFSYSRSLLIGVGAAILFYLIYMGRGGTGRFKICIALFLSAVLIFGVINLGYFSFSLSEGSKALSTSVRIAKMSAAWDTFKDNPFFGIGYGAVGVVDSRGVDFIPLGIDNPEYFNQSIGVKASAEFTPLQVLAETGLASGLIVLILIIASFKRVINILGDARSANFLKVALLCWIIFFITGFVGGNAYGTLIFMLAIPYMLEALKYKI